MEQTKKKRYHILDSIRGITLISMIGFHTVWDLVYIFDVNWVWYETPIAYIWQQSICWVFIALSGFCWSLGRRKLRRGLTVLAAGFLVSLVTEVFMPDQIIRFGVLTLLGCSMLLMIPLDKMLPKVHATIGLAVSLLAFCITRNVNDGSLGFESMELVKLPRALYQMGDAGNFLGFTEPRFYSADYFSLIPWFFLYGTGYFLNGCLSRADLTEKLSARGQLPVLNWAGRHSLILYLLHQPALYGLCILGRYFLK
jgi:uncharacterized membrane protein